MATDDILTTKQVAEEYGFNPGTLRLVLATSRNLLPAVDAQGAALLMA